ncbi:3-hydroxyacyl-CoA dehydrogenase family protein, partial [uncultured Flavonifractor sp.]|uniref:3-hydroxyacyl-CoA dehydrogenase family protein n=1 Tax=uncultured Flavonifractor sp. TaxID=1193534 RepID=UPI002617E533
SEQLLDFGSQKLLLGRLNVFQNKIIMGPLQLADFIGLDTVLAIVETLYEGYADSKYRPCPLLRQYVKAGWLGKKSGRGFYQYE